MTDRESEILIATRVIDESLGNVHPFTKRPTTRADVRRDLAMIQDLITNDTPLPIHLS